MGLSCNFVVVQDYRSFPVRYVNVHECNTGSRYPTSATNASLLPVYFPHALSAKGRRRKSGCSHLPPLTLGVSWDEKGKSESQKRGCFTSLQMSVYLFVPCLSIYPIPASTASLSSPTQSLLTLTLSDISGTLSLRASVRSCSPVRRSTSTVAS